MPNQPARELPKSKSTTRSIRVPSRYWGQWEAAAKIAGVDRNKFIITVCNHAAHTILGEEKDKKRDGEATV